MPNPNETEDTSFMDAHFEAAGIENEPTGAETTSGTGNETTPSSSASDQIQGTTGKDSISGGVNSDTEQKPKEEPKVAADPKSGQQQPAKDQLPAGALKLQDGTIIQPGAERRWFDNMNLARDRERIAKQDLNTATQQRNTLQTKYNELESTVKKIGLEDPQQVSSAVGLYQDLQRDPVGTVTKLLAELKAKGHTVDGIGSQVDTRAISAILDQRLKPSEQQQQQQSQQEIDKEVQEEVTSFLRDFPDAVTHEAYIAKVVDGEAAKGNQVTLRDAYFALKERAINDGLDWTQPLGPQLIARRNAGQQQQQVPRTPGRQAVLQSSEEIDPAKVIQPDNDTSDAIVKAAMREAGLKV